uniref:N/A n=1 Tax=Ganoderma boninense TaxID=34458 RepID=A0A5K1JRN8_9APHY|nr:N/A [Ganoderma boninense]
MAAFTVKATYRSETRKFSFSDPFFPSYDELYNQLYRVFPISHSFYLSKLLFSPNSSSSARLLIGKEVHSAEEYNHHVAPYQGRSWPGALLRFSVFDETPHKSTNVPQSDGQAEVTVSSPSSHSHASASTAATSASSTTVVGLAADARPHLRGDRRLLLSRIRESTSNRSSFHTMPPTPPASSRPTSMAESSSRPISLFSEPEGWRPLPPRPPSRGESTASNASVRTARPSLFDLLASTSPPTTVPRAANTRPVASSGVVDLSCDRETSSRRESLWKNVRHISEAVVSDHKSPSPKLPSIDDLSLPVRPSSFVAPPPPVLFSQPSVKNLRAYPRPLQLDGDVVMHSEPFSRSYVTPPSVPGPSETTQRSAQRAQPPQSNPRERIKELKRSGRLFRMLMEETDPHVEKKAQPCCSVSEAKVEIKALMEKFKSDYERTLTKAFGEDWDKSSPKDEDAPLPRLPSPPTHPPVLLDFDHLPPKTGRPAAYLPPPPPPPCMIPPPPSLMVPPPPLCIVPPPPPPPLVRGTSTFGRQSSAQDERSAPSQSSSVSTPPLPPSPPSWIPAVAFNPVQVAGQHKDASADGERLENEETVHKNVRCDFCGKQDIKGTRYKCLQCPDFDLCNACMASPKAWEAHTVSHAFFPIHTKEEFPHFCLVKDSRRRRQLNHSNITCDGCQQKNIVGVRHKCLQCEDFDLCDMCVSSANTRQEHDVSHVFFPIETPGEKEAYYRAREEAKKPAVVPPAPLNHVGIRCDGCDQYPLVGVRHRCLDCDDFDFCTSCMSDPVKRESHDISHGFFPMNGTREYSEFLGTRENYRRSRAESLINESDSTQPLIDAPPVHRNVICDVCSVEIIGVRHKCLDCPDYDLCEECISTPPLRGMHPSHHQFFGIKEPGEVIVHTVFSGDGEREPTRSAPAVSPRVNLPRVHSGDAEPVVHNAKCLNCPDYDVCQRCYKITAEQHPDHGFVKVSEPAVIMIRDTANDPVHYAICDVCKKHIKGCVHESCIDFDLCEHCEACPIPVHPIHHPLLKLKTPSAVIPPVLRARNGPPMPMNPSSPVRSPNPFGIEYAETPMRPPSCAEVREDHHTSHVYEPAHIHSPILVPECPFVNAPAQPPALPLPEFTPDLEVPALPPVSPPRLTPSPRPYPQSLNPFSCFEHPSPEPVVFTCFNESVDCLRLPSPRSPPPPLSPRPLSPISDVEFAPARSPSPPRLVPVRSWEDIFGRITPITEATPMVPQSMQLMDFDDRIEFVSPEEPANQEREQFSPPVSTILRDEQTEVEGTVGGISTPSDIPVSSSGSAKSVPKLAPVNSEWTELWPELTSMFKHLLPPSQAESSSPANPSSGVPVMPGAIFTEEPRKYEGPAASVVPTPGPIEESPLVGEPLLCRPLIPEWPEKRFTVGRSLSDLITSMSPVRSTRLSSPESPVIPPQVVLPPAPAPELLSSPTVPSPSLSPVTSLITPFWQSFSRPAQPLLAAFVSDNNIPVGQIFPPGAEFVKSWRMRNDGTVDWPETTELVFVAGDRMAPYNGALPRVKVGSVKAGDEVELVSGEMKAPEVSGKYVSSWRLSDGKGNLFGHSVWVE